MRIKYALILLLLAGCTTPVTVMKNEDTGQVTRCGGNPTASIIGYYMLKSSDADCVTNYTEEGFKKVQTSNP